MPVVAILIGTVLLAHLAFRWFPALFDVDAYFHLAIARASAGHGTPRTLDWARFSVMHDGFGDKEFLFHVFLRPFASGPDPTAGGSWALALLVGLVAAVLAHAGRAAIGPWGLATPLLVFGSMDFTSRMVRLRPEVVALVLLLVAVTLAGQRRAGWLGVVACIFTLTYTPFQAFLGLCVLFAFREWWVERRCAWRLLLFPALGVAAGLLLHPDFPANVRIWWIQNVTFFLEQRSFLPSGENAPRTTTDLVLLNLPWLGGLAVLWAGREPSGTPRVDARLRDVTILATLAFAALYAASARFVTYFVPFATLAVLRTMAAAGEGPGPVVRLGGGRRLPFAAVYSLCLVAAVCSAPVLFRLMQAGTGTAFGPEARAERETFGRAVPAGAKVFASWDAAEQFVFWAPQASYVNLLDPVFMFARSPELYRASEDVLHGREPDMPLVVRSRFDSDFIADDGQHPFARARLADDPRVSRLLDGSLWLYRVEDGGNESLLLDWKVLPASSLVPPPLELIADPRTPAYPRAPAARDRAVEGYVDGRRIGLVDGCVTFARIAAVAEPEHVQLEVSPYGPAEVFVDDALLAVVTTPRLAVLGNGVVVPLTLSPGQHRMTIRTCASDSQLGFYARVRRSSAP